jgi:hypothetical protein
LLIVAGAFVLYAVVHGKLGSPGQASGSSPGGGGSAGGAGNGGTDSGTHQAIDLTGAATGTVGSVYTVSSTYGGASEQTKDDMNAFAHQIGNVVG